MSDANALALHGRVPTRVSIQCTQCHTLTRVYRVEPTTQIGALRYCPLCAEPARVYMSDEDNGWEATAVHYNMSVNAVRALHQTWNPHEFYRFSDFVTAMREEARTGQPQPHKPYPYSTESLSKPVPVVATTAPARTTRERELPPTRPLPRMRRPI